MAHLPFVPSIILGLTYFEPGIIPTLNPKVHGKRAKDARRILWLQFALQAYTGIFGHAIPNPRVVFNQEMSISLAFTLLFALVRYSTPEEKNVIGWKLALGLTVAPVMMFLTVGLLPVVFLSFFAAIFVGSTFEGAFGKFTPAADRLLLSVFVPTVAILGVETFACEYLQQEVGATVPWHLLFDLLFWQVVGTALDVVVIAPPGRFMKQAEGSPHIETQQETKVA